MPRRPDFSQHRPDPRFDRYRDRVGRLHRQEKEVGLVLVLTEAYATQVGGHLWWRRWGPPQELLWEWTVVDGQFSDSVVPEDAAEDVVKAYDFGRFDYYGQPLRVDWADGEESARLRSMEFGR